MKIHYCVILSACVLSLFANCVVAQQPLAVAPLLTANEQARLIGMATTKGAIPLQSPTAAGYHVAKVQSLLDQMDGLPTDGTRSGNPLFRKVHYHLESARLAGSSYDVALNEVFNGQKIAPELKILRRRAIVAAMKANQELGLLTPENMQRLQQGKSAVITKGNVKYLGQRTHVDHRVPIGGPNGAPIYENEPANMQVLPESINLAKGAKEDEFTAGRKAKLDQAHKANRYAKVAGALSTGAGIALLYTSTRGILDASKEDMNDIRTKMRIGEQGSLFVAGGAFTASGVAQIGSRFATTESSLAKLGSISKWGGRVGIAGIILGESVGIGIDYYNWDEMTPRQQSASLVRHGVSIGGLALSFGVGCLLGIETGPGAIAFGLAAAGATYGATKVATSLVEGSYDRLDGAQKKEVSTAIFKSYGVSQ